MIKLVCFDFDGTVIDVPYSTWLPITEAMDVVDENLILKKRFLDGEISYLDWSRETVNLYVRSGLTLDKFKNIFESHNIVDGFDALVDALKTKGIRTAIVSGGIENVYEMKFQNKLSIDFLKFSARFLFDGDGKIYDAVLKDYDFDGKAKAVDEICSESGINPAKEVAFVGDSMNDLSVMKHVALGIAFKSKVEELKKQADYIANSMGEVHLILERLLGNQSEANFRNHI